MTLLLLPCGYQLPTHIGMAGTLSHLCWPERTHTTKTKTKKKFIQALLLHLPSAIGSSWLCSPLICLGLCQCCLFPSTKSKASGGGNSQVTSLPSHFPLSPGAHSFLIFFFLKMHWLVISNVNFTSFPFIMIILPSCNLFSQALIALLCNKKD